MVKKCVCVCLAVLLCMGTVMPALSAAPQEAATYPAAQITQCTSVYASGNILPDMVNHHTLYADGSIAVGGSGNSVFIPDGYPAQEEPFYNAYTFSEKTGKSNISYTFEGKLQGFYALQAYAYDDMAQTSVQLILSVPKLYDKDSMTLSFSALRTTDLSIVSQTMDDVPVDSYAIDATDDTIGTMYIRGENEAQTFYARFTGPIPNAGQTLRLVVSLTTEASSPGIGGASRTLTVTETMELCIAFTDKRTLGGLLAQEAKAARVPEDFATPDRWQQYSSALTAAQNLYDSPTAQQTQIEYALWQLQDSLPDPIRITDYGDGIWSSYDPKTATLTVSGKGTVYHEDSLAQMVDPDADPIRTLVFTQGIEGIETLRLAGNRITDIYIPSTVQTIAPGVFRDFSALKRFHVEADNAHYSASDGVLLDKAQTQLVAFPRDYDATDGYGVPQTVHTILPEAVFIAVGCTVFFPYTVRTFDWDAVRVQRDSVTGECGTFLCDEGTQAAKYADEAALDGVQKYTPTVRPICFVADSETQGERIDCTLFHGTQIEDIYDENGALTARRMQMIECLSDDLPTAARTGYQFIGWFTQPVGGEKAPYGITVTDDTVLYAHWQPNTYTVCYVSDGGSDLPPAQEKTHGVDLTLSDTVPQRAYTVTYDPAGGTVSTHTRVHKWSFTGWNTAANGSGTAYAPGQSYTPDADVTLYAQWAPPTLTLPTPTHTDCIFEGWFTEDGTAATEFVSVDRDMTVTAHWREREKFTVTYHGNGGTDVPSAQIKSEGIPLTLSDGVPHRTYTVRFHAGNGTVNAPDRAYECTFLGWNTSPNAGGTAYASGQSYTLDADATLYAQWTVPQMGFLPVPTCVGSYFDGWYTQPQGGTAVTTTTAVTQDTELYAHWKTLSYSFNNWAPVLNASVYRSAFGSSTLTDRLSAVVASMVYPNSGICFGMATTAMLLTAGTQMPTEDFGVPSIWDFMFRRIAEYTNGRVTLEDFIKQMQVSQYSVAAQSSLKQDIPALLATVESGELVRIGITDGKQGHALVGYKLERVSNDVCYLYVYDCNHSGDYGRAIRLARTTGGWTWSYAMGDGLGIWSSDTGTLAYQTYDDIENLWNHMGRLAYATSDSAHAHLLIVCSDRFVIEDENGQEYAVYDGGLLRGPEELLEITVESTALTPQAETTHLFYIPLNTCTVRNLAGGVLHTELIDVRLGVVADTTADTVYLSVRDSEQCCRAKISESSADAYTYALAMLSDTALTDNAVQGSAEKPLEFSLENGEVCAGFLQTLSLQGGKNRLYYGESSVWTVQTDPLPEGTRAVWTTDSDAVSLTPSADGLQCTVTSAKNGTANVAVHLVDANGNVRRLSDGQDASASVCIRSRVNLFRIVLHFLRTLFRIRKVPHIAQ